MASADVQLPKTQKAAVYDNPGSLSIKIEDHELPEPGPSEVLINITHSGVCHSDLSVMLNGWQWLPAPTPAGQVGGHEGVGKVVKLGPGSEAHLKIGDRVGVKWLSSACGGCLPCLQGHDGVCANQKISGYMTPGTFQQYTLGPAHYVTPIPDALSSAEAAPFLCGGVTAYSALRKCGAIAGQWLAIIGAGGGLGHLAVQMASRGMGYRVIGVDHSSKEKLAKDSGAEHFIAVDTSKDVVEEVKGLTNTLGVAAAIVLVGSNPAYTSALDMLQFGGTLVVVGIPEGDMQPIGHAYPGVLIAKELKIQGVAVGDRRDAIETLNMAARGIIKMHYTEEKLENLPSIFEKMKKGELQGRVVVSM